MDKYHRELQNFVDSEGVFEMVLSIAEAAMLVEGIITELESNDYQNSVIYMQFLADKDSRPSLVLPEVTARRLIGCTFLDRVCVNPSLMAIDKETHEKRVFELYRLISRVQ